MTCTAVGAAPAEVATQLARSAEPGDTEAIGALRQAAQSLGHSDASAAADLSKRALELLPAHDAEYGSLVAETVALLNRADQLDRDLGGRRRGVAGRHRDHTNCVGRQGAQGGCQSRPRYRHVEAERRRLTDRSAGSGAASPTLKTNDP
jgi:hypothetical protein